MYLCIRNKCIDICALMTINKKEVMNLKESKERYMERVVGEEREGRNN